MGSGSEAITLGYYTVVHDERSGWTGGLLVLNGGGRPLEFQCTLPIRPTRAHEILFGSTLQQHLIAEVIGPTLLDKCRTPISLLCCEHVDALKLQDTCGSLSSDQNAFGVVLLDCDSSTEDRGNLSDDSTQASLIRSDWTDLPGHCKLTWDETQLQVALERVEQVERLLPQLADFPDATEPFERIREAIREAQSQMSRAA